MYEDRSRLAISEGGVYKVGARPARGLMPPSKTGLHEAIRMECLCVVCSWWWLVKCDGVMETKRCALYAFSKGCELSRELYEGVPRCAAV